MSYNINVSGSKADALAALDAQAAQQRNGLPGDYEKGLLDAAVKDAKEKAAQFSGDDDNVSISVSGHSSQGGNSFAVGQSSGISIAKGAAAATRSAALDEARALANKGEAQTVTSADVGKVSEVLGKPAGTV